MEVQASPLLIQDDNVGKRLHCSEPQLISDLKIRLRLTHTRLLCKLFILYLQSILIYFYNDWAHIYTFVYLEPWRSQ